MGRHQDGKIWETSMEKGLCEELLKKEKGNDRHTPWHRNRVRTSGAVPEGESLKSACHVVKLSWAVIIADQICWGWTNIR